MSGCIWCGKSPTTNTHALRKAWLAKLLPGTERLYHRHVRTGQGGELDTEWESTRLGMDPHCACQSCNGGWMHDLDLAGEAIAEPMTFGHNRTLTDDDRLTLGTWLTLVAIVLDHIQAAAVIPPDAHKQFYVDPAPLPNSAIWLARTETTRPMANAWPISWKVELGGEVSHPYFCTIRVNDFVAQVFIPTEPTSGGNFKMDGRFACPIWPWSGSVEWPPLGVVGEDDLPAYVERFKSR